MTTTEEYAERRERWAQALESGKYKQTREALHDSQGYCCLGVACELYRKEEHKGRWLRDAGSDEYVFLGRTDLLPLPVQIWLGLRAKDGTYAPRRTLASDNDDEMSFEEIAAIIRRAPEGLFND